MSPKLARRSIVPWKTLSNIAKNVCMRWLMIQNWLVIQLTIKLICHNFFWHNGWCSLTMCGPRVNKKSKKEVNPVQCECRLSIMSYSVVQLIRNYHKFLEQWILLFMANFSSTRPLTLRHTKRQAISSLLTIWIKKILLVEV